jgi:hypothetical protein
VECMQREPDFKKPQLQGKKREEVPRVQPGTPAITCATAAVSFLA